MRLVALTRRHSLLVIGVVLALAAAAILIVQGAEGSPSDDPEEKGELYRTAADLLEDDSEVAAYVNGRPIPMSMLNAYDLLLRQGHGPFGPEQELPFDNLDAFLSMLIDMELLYQEAERRGLAPSDDEVVGAIRQIQQELNSILRDDTKLAREIRTAVESVAGTSFDIDTLDSNPVALEAYRKVMAIGALREQLLDTVETREELLEPGKGEALVRELLEQLRASAKIEVVAELP